MALLSEKTRVLFAALFSASILCIYVGKVAQDSTTQEHGTPMKFSSILSSSIEMKKKKIDSSNGAVESDSFLSSYLNGAGASDKYKREKRGGGYGNGGSGFDLWMVDKHRHHTTIMILDGDEEKKKDGGGKVDAFAGKEKKDMDSYIPKVTKKGDVMFDHISSWIQKANFSHWYRNDSDEKDGNGKVGVEDNLKNNVASTAKYFRNFIGTSKKKDRAEGHGDDVAVARNLREDVATTTSSFKEEQEKDEKSFLEKVDSTHHHDGNVDADGTTDGFKPTTNPRKLEATTIGAPYFRLKETFTNGFTYNSGDDIAASDDLSVIALSSFILDDSSNSTVQNGSFLPSVTIQKLVDGEYVETNVTMTDGVIASPYHSDVLTQLAVSGDGKTIAVAQVYTARGGNDALSQSTVRIFKESNGSWSLLDTPYSGNAGGGGSKPGLVVSLTSNGDYLLVGERYFDNKKGKVMLYSYDESSNKYSLDNSLNIVEADVGDQAGSSVMISRDGSCFIYGSVGGNSGKGSAHVYCKNSNGTSFVHDKTLQGTDLKSDYGFSVAITTGSNDEVVAAVGARLHDSNDKVNAGLVQVYKKLPSASSWLRLGSDIIGDRGQSIEEYHTGDEFGFSISLGNIQSDKSLRLAVGSPNVDADGGGRPNYYHGQVSLYEISDVSASNDSQDWNEIANGINGDSKDSSGSSVVLSTDGKQIAIASPNREEDVSLAVSKGIVHVYLQDEYSDAPNQVPSNNPSDVPSLTPSDIPSDVPSDLPSSLPSNVPSSVPSLSPSDSPSNLPSSIPSDTPSDAPSDIPSDAPSDLPSSLPSDIPSNIPSLSPSDSPSDSSVPSDIPSDSPSDQPSSVPSSMSSDIPSDSPSDQPSSVPSSIPSDIPSDSPSDQPSLLPSSIPSDIPSDVPSDASSDVPSDQPSSIPSSMPSDIPSDIPSDVPSDVPSNVPSDHPSSVPSSIPSDIPSDVPSDAPSDVPSDHPSDIPSSMPSDNPSDVPSDAPSDVPSDQPSLPPSSMPSDIPSDVPSDLPSSLPSISNIPSLSPSDSPSDLPSSFPSSFTSRNFIIKSTFSDSLEDFCLTVDKTDTKGKLYIRKCQLDSEDIRKRQVWTFNEKMGLQLALTSDNYCLQSIYRQLQLFTCDGSLSVENFQFVCPENGDVNCKNGMLKQFRTNTEKSFFIGFTENRIFERLRFFREGTVNESLNKWTLVFQDSFPSDIPSDHRSPSSSPSDSSEAPSSGPSSLPSSSPSIGSDKPSLSPSSVPSSSPSDSSEAPSSGPSSLPSSSPSIGSDKPSLSPSSVPSSNPSDSSEAPSSGPSSLPSSNPSDSSDKPSLSPSSVPSSSPSDSSDSPSNIPSLQPSSSPSLLTSDTPSDQPSSIPSSLPSALPSLSPSDQPSSVPSSKPSDLPSDSASDQPSSIPSSLPSALPSLIHSSEPSDTPSLIHSSEPSDTPSLQPSSSPSLLPSETPSLQPSSGPSSIPSDLPSLSPSSNPSQDPNLLGDENSHITFNDIDFGSTNSVKGIKITYANGETESSGSVEVKLGDASGTTLAQFSPSGTDSWVNKSNTMLIPFDNTVQLSGVNSLTFTTSETTATILLISYELIDLSERYTPFTTIHAPEVSTSSGVGGGIAIGYFNNGDYFTYSPIDFGLGANSIQITYSKDIGTGTGTFEIRKGNHETGEIIGTYSPASTGSWGTYATVEIPIKTSYGIDQLTFRGTGTFPYGIMNLKSFQLSPDTAGYICLDPTVRTHTASVQAAASAQTGANLVSIRCSAQQNAVASMSITTGPWIGGTDVENEGTWVLPDGSAMTYFNWNAGEPNNVGDEDCIIGSDGLWFDAPCNSFVTGPALFESTFAIAGLTCIEYVECQDSVKIVENGIQTADTRLRNNNLVNQSDTAGTYLSVPGNSISPNNEDNWNVYNLPIGANDDFVMLAKLKVDGSGSAASFFINDLDNFGFDGSSNQIFAHTDPGYLSAFSTGFVEANYGTHNDNLFYFKVERKLGTIKFYINEEEVASSANYNVAISRFFWRPWRADLKIYDWIVSSPSLLDFSFPSDIPSDQPSSHPSCSNELWSMLGNDIDGEAANDYSGFSVSLSSDGTTVAIGADRNNGNGTDSGHVRVYQYNNTAWAQLGEDIDGESADDHSGFFVSLSSDGTTVAIGADRNDANGSNSGHVRVYQYNNTAWAQLGADIDGESANNFSGRSVSLSSDGTTVAIGAMFNDGNDGSDSGHVRVYRFDTSTSPQWIKLGADIDGESAYDYSGFSVSLSSDGTTVAIGAQGNDGNGTDSGHVRVYRFDNSTSPQWTKLGEDIDGESADDYSGISVSLSSDGTTVAIGASNNDGNGTDSGHVRVYQYNNTAWAQLGEDIDGESADDRSGRSVSLSSDGRIVAIGAYNNDANGSSNAGHVRVYRFNTSASQWTRVGEDIDGEAAGDQSGRAISLSSDGTTVAIDGHRNNGNGLNDSGHVRVYNLMC